MTAELSRSIALSDETLTKPLLRVDLRRYWQKAEPLRRTRYVVQINIEQAGEGYVCEAAGARPFALTVFELRRWPVVQRKIESAIGCRVQAMTRREWAWDLAVCNLAPWTAEAQQYDEANQAWFDRAFEEHCEWMDAVGRDMARRRAAREPARQLPIRRRVRRRERDPK